MKYHLHINQAQAIELGIKGAHMAHIFDVLVNASSWAKPRIIDGEVYYWVSRNKVCEELPLFDLKPDTVYRNFKKIEALGLMVYMKSGKDDCIQITKLGLTYSSNIEYEKLGSKSESLENSDLNPNKLGSKSENNSDLNPTYTTTKQHTTTIDKKPLSGENETIKLTKGDRALILECDYKSVPEYLITEFVHYRRSALKKGYKTKRGIQGFINDLSACDSESTMCHEVARAMQKEWLSVYPENNDSGKRMAPPDQDKHSKSKGGRFEL